MTKQKHYKVFVEGDSKISLGFINGNVLRDSNGVALIVGVKDKRKKSVLQIISRLSVEK